MENYFSQTKWHVDDNMLIITQCIRKDPVHLNGKPVCAVAHSHLKQKQ